jgi:hypothetical protein
MREEREEREGEINEREKESKLLHFKLKDNKLT